MLEVTAPAAAVESDQSDFPHGLPKFRDKIGIADRHIASSTRRLGTITSALVTGMPARRPRDLELSTVTHRHGFITGEDAALAAGSQAARSHPFWRRAPRH